jgi:two-component system nitrogen regulation response regulator NtrX
MTDILVADNDSGMRAMLRELLEEEGHHVIEVADGRAALAYLRTADVPVVALLDQRMPLLAGTEIVDLCLAAGSLTTPREFIVLTGSPEGVKATLNGRAELIPKPFELETLLEAVAAAAARLRGN